MGLGCAFALCHQSYVYYITGAGVWHRIEYFCSTSELSTSPGQLHERGTFLITQISPEIHCLHLLIFLKTNLDLSLMHSFNSSYRKSLEFTYKTQSFSQFLGQIPDIWRSERILLFMTHLDGIDTIRWEIVH